MHAVTVTFGIDMTHEEFLAGCERVAPAFAAVPGLVSKAWLADADSGVYGGQYLFATRRAAEEYLSSELFAAGVRANPRFRSPQVRSLAVADAPTAVTTPGLREAATA